MQKIASFKKNGKEVRIPGAIRIEKKSAIDQPEIKERIIIIDVTKIEGKVTAIEINTENCNGFKCEVLVGFKGSNGKIEKKPNKFNFPLYIPVGKLDGMFPSKETFPQIINLFTKDQISVKID